jgi:membrane fusion protein (multidrug efflux system)
LLTLGFVAAGWFGANWALESDEGGGGGQGDGTVTVAVARVTERSVAETVETIGSIRPRRAIEVRPLASGRVASIGFESGQSVEAGAMLLRLDAAAERAALAEAEADLRAAESDLARADALAEREVRSPATVEDARAARDRAEARVAAAEAALADRRVTAPFAGVIGLTDTDPGERVDAETVITTLDDLAAVEVTFTLPERHYDAVAPGMAVRISGGGFENTVEAEIAVIAPRVDPETGSFALRALVDNGDRRLVGGMLAQVAITLEQRDTLTVPDDAVVSEGRETFVFVVEDGVARRSLIETGLRGDGWIEARGLAPSARVITAGRGRVEDGVDVQVESARDAPALEDAPEAGA